MLSHLLRRGLETASEQLSQEQTRDWQALHDRYRMPAWGMALIGITTIVFVLSTWLLEYTILKIMVNLAMVETPASTVVKIYGSVVDYDTKKEEVVDVDVEQTQVVSNKPLTSSIKRTIRHITSINGFSGRFRGLPIFLVNVLIVSAFHFITAPMHRYGFFGAVIFPFIVDMAAALMTARIHCAWTHATLTTGYKRYSERVINRVQWKQLLPARALKVAGQHLLILAMLVSGSIYSSLVERQSSAGARAAVALIPILTALFGWLFVLLPVSMVLVRKEASMLDESEETLVHFDRTFGNRVIPGLNNLKLRDAWASISRDTWRRVIRLHVKWVGIVAFIALVYFQVIVLEMWAIMGEALPQLLGAARAHLQGMA